MSGFRKKRRRRAANRDWTIRQNTFAVSTRWSVLIGIAALLGIGQVFMRQRNDTLNEQIRLEEVRNAELVEAHKKELGRWTMMTTPKNLDRAIARHGLALKRPLRQNVVRVACTDGTAEMDPDVVVYAMNR